MKTPAFVGSVGAIAAGLIAIAMPSMAATEQLPTGELNVNRDLVRVGTSPQLEWEVQFPSIIHEIVHVNPDGSVTLKQDARARVRVLGVGYGSATVSAPVRAQMSLNHGSSWSQFFYGTGNAVQSGQPLFNNTLSEGTRLDFMFDGPSSYSTNRWGHISWNWDPNRTSATTRTESIYVRALVNGDPVPDYAPAYSNQGSAADFLANYLTPEGKVNIGPRDVIYLVDVNTDLPAGHYGVDMQDIVVLVTFDKP